MSPWALVTVDGEPLGEAPLSKEVGAGRHRLEASHPQLGSDALVVDLAPGQQLVWRPELVR